MRPKFDLDKIKFSIDPPTWKRAIGLYKDGKVDKFEESPSGYSAIVRSTHPYRVIVSSRNYSRGDCTCYLGKRDILCKHMVAVAIHALKRGKPLTKEEETLHQEIIFSEKTGELDESELAEVKRKISEATRLIKAYTGPSKKWFEYQNSLTEGCNRLAAIFSNLPVSQQTTKLIVNLIARLNKKLITGGVDDSDGTVGGFCDEAMCLLMDFADTDPKCAKYYKKLIGLDVAYDFQSEIADLLGIEYTPNLI
jgi:hypothetical protein